MMASADRRVGHPPRVIWPFVADPGNWRTWLGEGIGARVTSQGPVDVGTSYRYTFHMLGMAFQGRGRVTVYLPYETFAVENLVAGLVLHERIGLRPAGTETVVTYTIDLVPANGLLRSLAALAGSLGASSTRRFLAQELSALERAVDAGTRS
jgi:Polyketide cyclase / dehydrase and lipid transport